jgi:hypothetical protein
MIVMEMQPVARSNDPATFDNDLTQPDLTPPDST